MAQFSGINIGVSAFFFFLDFSFLFRYTFKSDLIIVECSQIANALQVCLVLGCNVGSTKKALLSEKKEKCCVFLGGCCCLSWSIAVQYFQSVVGHSLLLMQQ